MVFVYYHDGYHENGDVGFESFEDRAEAAEFITKRMSVAENPSLVNYTVIEGQQLLTKAISFATKIEVFS